MILPTVVLADDHAIIVDGLRSLLQEHATVLGTCRDGIELLEATRKLKPDVVVTDMSMPRMSGLEYLRSIREDNPRPRVIMLSMYGDEALVSAALRAGARGYIPKVAAGEELLTAVREVMRGETYLSPLIAPPAAAMVKELALSPQSVLTQRQVDVLTRIAAGKRMKEIAAELHLSRRTVEMHKYRMMRALGVRSTAELIQYFVKHIAPAEPVSR